MSLQFLRQVREAVGNLNPAEVRNTAEQQMRVGLYAPDVAGYRRMEEFFATPKISTRRRHELGTVLHRVGDSKEEYHIEIWDERIPPSGGNIFGFCTGDPALTVNEILARRPELGLPLARVLYPFRKPVVFQAIQSISTENALFSIATALPDIIPNLMELPWAIGEFASDTAFLTINQIRMAFLIGAASDRPIGYSEQKAEIGSIIAGAFGWRALARELAGKIPFGGGLLPKAALAYAGTYVYGLSLERLYRMGYGYSRSERQAAYEVALRHGKKVVSNLMEGFRKSATVTEIRRRA